MPDTGQSFPFLTYSGGIFGSFATESLPPLPGGLFFDVAHAAGVLSLEVEGILGDYNRNGIVDVADYIVWRKTLGQTGTGLMADGDRDKEVDADDLDVWLQSFGESAPGAGSGGMAGGVAFRESVNVPEPGLLASLAVSVIIGIAVSGRRWRQL
jgi:hypothetical protein